MARAGRGSTTGAAVIARGALRCSNAACTASGKRTELDLTRERFGVTSGPAFCTVCLALAWLELACRRGEITGEDDRRILDEA